MRVQNSKGNIYYGMHFYPGLAQYTDRQEGEYNVFINEDTARQMNKTFTGRPVFVLHVDEVHKDIDQLKHQVDGWVVESFYNAADGKHWAKFIITSDRGERAINVEKMRLSNCYVPRTFGPGGKWNNVPYKKQVLNGEYEHLAIVPNPRYNESVILTPAQFKAYNEKKTDELKRIANANKEGNKMGLKFFNRQVVDNADQIQKMSVFLPTKKVEVTIEKLVNDADTAVEKGADMVEVDGKSLTVEQLLALYKECKAELDAMKDDGDDDVVENDDDSDDDDDSDEGENDDGDDDEPAPPKKKEEKAPPAKKPAPKDDDKKKNKGGKTKNSDDQTDEEKAEAKRKAKALRNAQNDYEHESVIVDLPTTQVARGKARYGR